MSNAIAESCTGCGACCCICPHSCITMGQNSIAERIPVIDETKCTHCYLCQKVCPQLNPLTKVIPQRCYVAWSVNESDLLFSASGGVAAAIARYQIDNNSKIYGCDYNSSADLCYFSVEHPDDILKMESSKYSQSEAYPVFKEIKKELSENRSVVFIGTPCQVAAIRKFLMKDYENLITVDLVCHGTPPNTYFKEYLQEIGIHPPFEKIRFRGEYDQQLTIWKNGEVVYQKPYKEDLYFSAFYKNKISMDVCYSCHYAQSKRVSDITIADFWGLGELSDISARSDRPSLVLINSNKGQAFFDAISTYLVFEERSVLEAINGNGRLNNPPGKSLEAKAFQSFYRHSGFRRATLLSAKIRSVQDYIEVEKEHVFKTTKRIRKAIKKRIHK